MYHEALRESSIVTDLLADAKQVHDVRVEQDYSYVAGNFAGPGYVLSGDAACFLDPLLSTGVHLATYSGMLAAASIGSVLRGEVGEDEGLAFYGQVYRQVYERLLVLVSVFYQSYRGRDHHFYHAQRLTRREQDELNLHMAFLRIITGIEDLEDAKEAAYQKAVDHLVSDGDGSGGNPFAKMGSVQQRQAPISPDNAVGGLYLSFGPKLGLRRAPAAVAADR